jgi:hypothetical protein
MRTTVDINRRLLTQAKKLAALKNRTFQALVEDGLRLVLQLERKQSPQKRKEVELPACNAGNLLPGVDLNDTSRLLEIE